MGEVYEPAEDSWLLEKWVKAYSRGRVLDMGTGSGIQAKAALEGADEVVAVDKNQEALARVKENNPEIETIESDLFNKVHGKFDLLVFNPPYLPKDDGIEDDAIYGGKKGFEIVERFLRRAKGHLKKEGDILFLFSSLTKKNKVEVVLEEEGYAWHSLDEKRYMFEVLYVYKAWLK